MTQNRTVPWQTPTPGGGYVCGGREREGEGELDTMAKLQVRGSRFPKRKRKKQWVNLPLLPTHSSLRGGKVALEQLDPLSFSMVRRPCCRPWVLRNLIQL